MNPRAQPPWSGELANGLSRAWSVARAKHQLRRIGPAGTIFGSRTLGEEEPEFFFARELAFWLGLYGFSTKTGAGPAIMKAGNQGCWDAGLITDKMAQLSRRSGAEGVGYPEIMQRVATAGPWQHISEIVALSEAGRLPHPAEAVLQQVKHNHRCVSIGVTAAFLLETEKPNQFIERLFSTQEFADRHELLNYRSEFYVFLPFGRLGTEHEFVELLNQIKHQRLLHLPGMSPLPPVYLVEPADGDRRWWRDKIDFLSMGGYISHRDLAPMNIVPASSLAAIVEDILYSYGERHAVSYESVQPQPLNMRKLESIH